MDRAAYLSSLSFNVLQPETARAESLRFPLERQGGTSAELLELPGAPIDVYNTRLPEHQRPLAGPLRRLCEMPRMSTFATAALINDAVARMPAGQVYVNVGVYAGFTFLSGMLQNPTRGCVGIDNFSANRPAREGLSRRFEATKGPAHRFHEMDYRDYFADVHSEPIGVYLYDGDHAYEHQRRGLALAEPYFADGCIVIVDDTNWEAAREATIDFVAESERHYDLLLDRSTSGHTHPTLWNGLMVLQASERGRAASPAEVRARFAHREYAPTRPGANVEPRAHEPYGRATDGDRALVSVVLINDDPSGAPLRAAIEACLAQTWPRTELVVLDRSGGEPARAVAGGYAKDLVYVSASADGPRSGLDQALARTTGELVGFADVAVPLRRTAVEIAVRLPAGAPFFLAYGETRYAEHEQALLGR